ncbi:MAG: GGDEF and EAL domain-containing protein [Alphaproteobacteria bacterium]|nr:GGDEF and EAL domain-containing protein [Alphaproteobacteria bacterium]
MLSQTLPKKPVDGMRALAAAHEIDRLRLSVAAAREVSFDWTLHDDRIAWDGDCEILSLHTDPNRLYRGDGLRRWMCPQSQADITRLIETRAPFDRPFELEFEASSALETIVFEMRGVRIARPDGQAERLSGIVRVVTEKKRENQRLHYLATRDELTGHLNRTSLRTELAHAIEQAKRQKGSCAYLVTAIDRLAMINEAYGFGAADEVIVAVGERISKVLRADDIIGRSAGNKLGIILTTCSEREISVVAERLRESVRCDLIATRAGQVAVTISVGAVFLPGAAASSQEAMLRAEEALDRARAGGRDGFAVYAKSAQREMARLRLMAIADEVVSALKEKRLVFAYQPIVTADEHLPVHYECLLRLRRSDGEVVSAGHFIPAAEQLGLVRLVDRCALEMAISQLRAQPRISLAVNVSGTSARDPAWLESFVGYVRCHRDVARRMIVELTETAALNDFEESARFVSNLRELGCTVAIDDFGAGYTSFRNLQMLNVDMVKIDGSYVKGLCTSPDNQIFVRTLVDLARNFQLKTVAEWVSSDEEGALLESFGVDYFQGFHFGMPTLEPDFARSATSHSE